MAAADSRHAGVTEPGMSCDVMELVVRGRRTAAPGRFEPVKDKPARIVLAPVFCPFSGSPCEATISALTVKKAR